MLSSIGVSQRIKAFNKRLPPKFVKRKYELLAEDPFRFYRGTNHLFYEDLSHCSTFVAGPNVWLSGDLHLENFGSYRGDNRLVYFDISDFDEGMLGPALWEVARMITSIFVGFETLGISEKSTEKCAQTYLKTYAETLANGKARHIELGTATGIIKELLEKVSERKEEKWLKKRVEENKNGNLAFKEIENKQLELEDKKLKNALIDHISKMRLYKNDSLNNFAVLDACCRIAGTGSVGLNRYLFLLETDSGKKRHWLLDMKQARQPSLYPYVQVEQPAWETEAERVINIKFRMQDVPEALLTTTVFDGDSYIIQEMQPTEDKVEFHQVEDDFEHVFEVMSDMAMLTASAQLRSSGTSGSAIADELVAFGKSAHWQNYILTYSVGYAKQVKDYFKQYRDDYENDFFE